MRPPTPGMTTDFRLDGQVAVVTGALGNLGTSNSCSGASAVRVAAIGMRISGLLALGAHVLNAERRPAAAHNLFISPPSAPHHGRCVAPFSAP